MESDILDAFEDLEYWDVGNDFLAVMVQDGSATKDYSKLIAWIVTQISAVLKLQNVVTEMPDDDDSSKEAFLIELSEFLRDFGCPHQSLVTGPAVKRLVSRQDKILLLDYLLSELMAIRMIAANKPEFLLEVEAKPIKVENDLSSELKAMLICLGFPKPPEGITAFQLFSKVESKIKELLSKVSANCLSRPLLKAHLSEKQWETVNYICEALRQEYYVRREMMLKRLDVTIQSFKWSDKAKSDDKLAALYRPIRMKLSASVATGIPHLLAAREDLTQIEKTSSGSARERTRCDINKVVIGKVPDRGGRATEHDVPVQETFQQQHQQRQQPQQQRQHGERGSGRGHHHGQGRGHHASGEGGGGGGWSQGPAQQQFVLNMPAQLNPNAAAFFGQSQPAPNPVPGAFYAAPPTAYDLYQQQQQYSDRGGGRRGGRGSGGRGRRGH